LAQQAHGGPTPTPVPQPSPTVAARIESPAATLAFMRGRQLVFDGRLDEAIPHLEDARSGSPNDPLLNAQLAEIYLRLDKSALARERAEKAVEGRPTDASYRLTLAHALVAEKRYSEAQKELEKVLELDPKNNRVQVDMALLRQEQGDVAGALKILGQAIDRNPENALALFRRALLHLQQESIEPSIADLERCVALRPTFVEAGELLGTLYERTNRPDQAVKAYERIQGNGRFRKRLAQLYLQRNEFEKALAELLEYEKYEDDDFTAKVKIGLVHLELKQYAEAARRFQSILADHPDADNVRFYLAYALEESGAFDAAIVEYQRLPADSSFHREAMLRVVLLLKQRAPWAKGEAFARMLVAKFPDAPEFVDIHASFYEQKKNFARAYQIVQEGLKRHGNEERLHYVAGVLLERLGDRKKAIASMRRVLELNDRNAHALNFIGYTYAEIGENLDEAETLVRKALELRPNDGFIEDSMGWVYFRQGKLDLAEKHLKRAAELQPAEAVIFDHLGDYFAKRGDREKAIEHWKKAAELVKDDATLRRRILEKVGEKPEPDTKGTAARRNAATEKDR
jgi:tetratricopeptide (TPR) repeat protein